MSAYLRDAPTFQVGNTQQPLVARVRIDPNLRVRGNQTFAGFEDVDGAFRVGSIVVVYEEETGLIGVGQITEVDPRESRRLVYLEVDWPSLAYGSGPVSRPFGSSNPRRTDDDPARTHPDETRGPVKKRKDETSKEAITKKAIKGWLERNNKPTYGKWVQEGIDRAKKG